MSTNSKKKSSISLNKVCYVYHSMLGNKWRGNDVDLERFVELLNISLDKAEIKATAVAVTYDTINDKEKNIKPEIIPDLIWLHVIGVSPKYLWDL